MTSGDEAAAVPMMMMMMMNWLVAVVHQSITAARQQQQQQQPAQRRPGGEPRYRPETSRATGDHTRRDTREYKQRETDRDCETRGVDAS